MSSKTKAKAAIGRLTADQPTILLASGVVVAVTYLNRAVDAGDEDVGPRPLVAGTIMALGLSLIAGLGRQGERLAVGLAVLAAVSSAVAIDRRVLEGVTRLAGGRLPGMTESKARDVGAAGISSLADIAAKTREAVMDSETARAYANGQLRPNGSPAPSAGSSAGSRNYDLRGSGAR